MGKVTTYTYNALGKVESVTDSMSHRTEFTYNSRGQNTAVRDASNNVSSATYDLLGNVTRLAGPLGGATNYTYDDMGRLTSESTVSGGTKSYEYNELNVRKKITNARGQIRQVFYDAMGRITGYNSPEGSVSYTYDANGNVLTVVDNHGTITRTYDALNRVSSYTDTYGKVIRYEYDAVGNLSKLIYPDNTAVTYAYDANHNLIRVTDWANRVTTYTYDVNNRVVGVTKPDGSVTTTVYDNKQRVTSTVERTATGAVITGFEYTYDDLSRIVEEKHLDKNTKFCYTYDSLNRVTKRTTKNLNNVVLSEESFTYDAAGNVTSAPDSSFQYDTNNRLISFNGNTVSYDLDGNMLSNGSLTCTYDSANRLVSSGGHTYTYNAEDVRIRNLCTNEDTTYTYNTNCKLSKLLTKTTGGVVTKYVYGRGLIGEETSGAFKTYHFDCRGSTIAITNASGTITDTFAYDTYGKLLSRTGTSKVIFGYNGRDGVVTDDNGLIYMRARYYSPEMKRFINADIIPGKLSNAITLNRFAYANANPAMNVDPTGLLVGALIAGGFLLGGLLVGLTSSSKQEDSATQSSNPNTTQNRQSKTEATTAPEQPSKPNITSTEQARALYLSGQISLEDIPPQYSWEQSIRSQYMEEQQKQKEQANPPKTQSDLEKAAILAIEKAADEVKDQVIDWGASKMDELAGFGDLIVPDRTPPSVYINAATKAFSIAQTIYGFYDIVQDNHAAGSPWQETVSDVGIHVAGMGWSAACGFIGTSLGTLIAPGPGSAVGAILGTILGGLAEIFYEIKMAPTFDDYYHFD